MSAMQSPLGFLIWVALLVGALWAFAAITAVWGLPWTP